MIFYSVIGLVLILLFWLRFLETEIGLWGAWCVWAIWSLYLIACFVRARRTQRSGDVRANQGRTE